jgi:drug/metabolite transporter (DMT)-like permease
MSPPRLARRHIIALVVYDPAAAGASPGIVLTIAGVGCCAVYTVATRRWLPGSASTLGVVAAQQAYALGFAIVLLGIAAVGVGVSVAPTEITPLGVASTVASGLVYYGLAYAFYLSGLRWVPASIAAMSFYLIPVFGVGAATLLGDRLAPLQWVGAIVVVIAVGAVTVRSTGDPAMRPRAG